MILNARPSIIAAVVIVMPLFSCVGSRSTTLGVKDSRLPLCPSSPNCVSSDDADTSHRIRPFQLALPAGEAWRRVRSTIATQPRTEIIAETDNYLHAKCSSALFGFVDDLELHLRPSQSVIAVRSASRLGHGDFGVNRKRVENLRSLLITQGVVR